MAQQSFILTDGTTDTAVDAGTQAAKVFVANTPTVTANAGTGNFTVVQATASNLNAAVIGTTPNNSVAGNALQSLVGQYNSVLPAVTDGHSTFLQTDGYGRLITSATVSFTYVANPGSAVPAQTAWIGASDGTNLRGLLVESSTASNLRTSLYYGATEMKIALDGYTAVHQADSPWVVSGTVAATQSGTWTVQQGTPPWTVTGTYGTNVAIGTDGVKGLVGRYQSSPAAVSDGNLTYLQTDGYGKLLTSAVLSPTFVAVPGTPVPADAAWVGGKDGSGNLQGFLVESNTNPNLRTGLYFGAAEASITASNGTAGNGLQVLNAQFHATGSRTTLPGPVDGYFFAATSVTDTNVTYAQTDGYGRLEFTPARAVAYAYENRTSQTVTLKSGPGVMRRVIVGDAGVTSALITFYDNTAGSGTIIGAVNTSNVNGQLSFDIPFVNGLTYVTNNHNPGSVTITFE